MNKKLLMVVAAVGLALGGGMAQAADAVRIGLMAPLTGSWASEGQGMKKIVELLAEQQNAKGGVLGRKIEVITEDDGGDPRTASLAAQRLTTQGVAAVVGTYGSSVTEASQAIYDEARIPQIANGSTAIRLTEKGFKLFFRTAPRDDEQGRMAAQTIGKLGFKKVAILHDSTSYAKGLAQEANDLLKKKGTEVVFFDALTPGERDYNAILTKLKGAKPEVVLFTGYYPEAGLLLRQKKEMNWKVPFIGGDATNNPDLVKIAGKEAAEGFYFLSPPVPQDLDTPEARAFLADYQKKYGEAPASIWAVLAGDGFRVAVAGMAGAKSAEGGKIAEYLHKDLKSFSGLSGPISFDAKGDREGDVYRVYQVDAEGKFVLQK
ncbi:MAG: branched-chain amino acid ABC transporter substrate-binding protein [Candidatus Competibacter sp.]|nr:branched-chain amino acid ABC transporter substrate-binding protein [Candidatus Competibacter sp.]MDG4607208.1 branched-chain amino acid ABC transporter substrate-binding protein [Candidatus Contendobacter sp.]HRD48667.1 branched-chain amino acid ABC transporter substrate-binding protein [Candidatus Contendobacter sp.]